MWVLDSYEIQGERALMFFVKGQMERNTGHNFGFVPTEAQVEEHAAELITLWDAEDAAAETGAE